MAKLWLNQFMCLTPIQNDHIRSTDQQLLGETVHIMWLGSRVRADLKGGNVARLTGFCYES
jgi:hypothetical protein